MGKCYVMLFPWGRYSDNKICLPSKLGHYKVCGLNKTLAVPRLKHFLLRPNLSKYITLLLT